MKGLERHWLRFDSCKGVEEQNVFLLSLLWDPTFQRVTRLCNHFFSSVFGVGTTRLARLRGIIDAYEGAVPEEV